MDNIDWGTYLTSFEGRINRAKYWLGVLIIAAIELAVGLFANNTVLIIVVVLLIWPALAIAVKRWHDRGKSGWWVLIGLVPIVGPIWALVETGFLPGDDGPNEYGPDPLAA